MAAEILLYDYTDIDPYWGDEIQYVIGQGKLTAENIRTQIVETSGELTVRINSVGGVVFDGWAIYNALVNYKTIPGNTVQVYIDGVAASIASIIAMAGDMITMMQASMMMVHKPTGFYFGSMDATDLQNEANCLTEIEAVLVDIYVSKTGLGATKVQNMIDAETWLSPDTAVSLGFADKVAKSDKKPVMTNQVFTNLFKNASPAAIAYVNSAFTIKHNEKNMSTVAELATKQDETNSLLKDFLNLFKGSKKNEGDAPEPEPPEVDPDAPEPPANEPTVEELKAKIKELEDKQIADKEKVDNATTILNQASEMYNKVQTQLAEIKSNYQPAGANTEFTNRGDQQVEPTGRFSKVK